jgi:hypothetical protein
VSAMLTGDLSRLTRALLEQFARALRERLAEVEAEIARRPEFSEISGYERPE